MFCPNCGSKIRNVSSFCSECGSKIPSNNASTRTVRLKCQECGGIMEVDENREILSCPYCNSKSVVLESDVIKVEKIRTEAAVKKDEISRDTVLGSKRLDLEQEQMKIEHEKWERKQNNKELAIASAIMILAWAAYIALNIFVP